MVRVFVVCLMLSLSAEGIVWRGDVEEIEARQLGEMKQVGKVYYSRLKVFGGSCVALGGKWVLTCRHGIEDWMGVRLSVGFPGLGEGTYAVKKVILCDDADLALLELGEDVKGAKGLAFFEGDDEVGKRGWLGGFGICGPVGKMGLAGIFHAGHNRVDGLRRGKLSISLGKPGEEGTEKDEALLAAFDSGSPLFLETKEGWRLAGIASTASSRTNPEYGDRGNYARVSRELEWIRGVVEGR